MSKVANLKSLVFSVRGQQVMLDADLAAIYDVEVKRLNESVKRNIEKFPPRFMFQLTENEYERLRFQIGTLNDTDDSLRSQIATSKTKTRGGRRYLPYVFTEHGVIMLSAVLNSPLAVKMNIAVIDSFVQMRRMVTQPLSKKIEDLERILMLHIDDTSVNLDNHTDRINDIIVQLNLLMQQPEPEPKRRIGFNID